MHSERDRVVSERRLDSVVRELRLAEREVARAKESLALLEREIVDSICEREHGSDSVEPVGNSFELDSCVLERVCRGVENGDSVLDGASGKVKSASTSDEHVGFALEHDGCRSEFGGLLVEHEGCGLEQPGAGVGLVPGPGDFVVEFCCVEVELTFSAAASSAALRAARSSRPRRCRCITLSNKSCNDSMRASASAQGRYSPSISLYMSLAISRKLCVCVRQLAQERWRKGRRSAARDKRRSCGPSAP